MTVVSRPGLHQLCTASQVCTFGRGLPPFGTRSAGAEHVLAKCMKNVHTTRAGRTLMWSQAMTGQ